MFVIDVYALYRYEAKTEGLVKVFDLDEIKSKTDLVEKMKKALLY